MSFHDESAYNESDCIAVFNQLFPQGIGAGDVRGEIAPQGWDHSPLLAVFHPSVEQLFEESVRLHRNLKALARGKNREERPEPTLEEVAKSYEPTPIDTVREVRELVGMCLWDVFSDNHEVIDEDGAVVDLGSFRASGGFIAEYLNRHVGQEEYDYIHFYLGTQWVSQRADLAPVYEMIFRRLKKLRLNWTYHFPKLHVIDMRPLRDALDQSKKPEWVDYSPEKAFAKEQEDAQRDIELAKLREDLEEGHREAVEAARESPPPATVLAYQKVYGEFPEGWPPTA